MASDRDTPLPTGEPTRALACPCCGIGTLPQRGAGDECTICEWRDWRGQNEHYPDRVVKGQNFGLSLAQARTEYRVYGSLDRSAYTPNEVPVRKRVVNGLIALAILAYAGFSVWFGTMVVPGNARYGGGALVLEDGAEIWLMSAAALSAAMYGVLSIVDHYDRRRNEHHYQWAVKASFVLMAVFMGLAIAAKLYREDGFWGGVAGGIGMLVIAGAVLVRMTQEDRIEY
ncbi:MAG TPA: CPCC family cysteine-rich protein [Usitatibacteraceae bacterium]|jgi:hypothetical protein|nr:CPCC family cysteine-rich protein [Usitatibacteraceae bacterium]HRA23205.1 CPCC family cysteine-rich protein [Usitatibacteraceae bacterium]